MSCLISAYKTYTAESDQTPADAVWLESIGVPHWRGAVGLCYSIDAKDRVLSLLFADAMDRKSRLIYSPTRGAVLKIVAGIGGGV